MTLRIELEASVIGLFIWARIDDQRQRSLVTGYPGPTAQFQDHEDIRGVCVQHRSASCRRRPGGLCRRRARGTAARTAPHGSLAMDGRSTAKCDIDGDWYEVIGERRWTLGRRQTTLMGGTEVLERDRLR
jgi:hypothetical protein